MTVPINTQRVFRGQARYHKLATFPKTFKELRALTPRLCVEVAETVQAPEDEKLLPTTLILIRGSQLVKSGFMPVDEEDKDAAGFVVRLHGAPIARGLLLAFFAQATLVIHSADAVRMVLAIRGKGVKTVTVRDVGEQYAVEDDPEGLEEIFGGLPEVLGGSEMKN